MFPLFSLFQINQLKRSTDFKRNVDESWGMCVCVCVCACACACVCVCACVCRVLLPKKRACSSRGRCRAQSSLTLWSTTISVIKITAMLHLKTNTHEWVHKKWTTFAPSIGGGVVYWAAWPSLKPIWRQHVQLFSIKNKKRIMTISKIRAENFIIDTLSNYLQMTMAGKKN